MWYYVFIYLWLQFKQHTVHMEEITKVLYPWWHVSANVQLIMQIPFQTLYLGIVSSLELMNDLNTVQEYTQSGTQVFWL